jgi:hypothetical protein
MNRELCFLDTEFTDLLQPELLSLGLVTLGGREHYVELDLSSECGRARKKRACDFVRHDGVLDMWGRVPGAASTQWEMGRRTGDWLLQLASEGGSPIEVAYDADVDFELMVHVIRDAGLWERVREIVWPVNVDRLTGTIVGELAAEDSYRDTGRRRLARHHALADAHALRRAYLAVKEQTLRCALGGPDVDP